MAWPVVSPEISIKEWVVKCSCFCKPTRRESTTPATTRSDPQARLARVATSRGFSAGRHTEAPHPPRASSGGGTLPNPERKFEAEPRPAPAASRTEDPATPATTRWGRARARDTRHVRQRRAFTHDTRHGAPGGPSQRHPPAAQLDAVCTLSALLQANGPLAPAARQTT